MTLAQSTRYRLHQPVVDTTEFVVGFPVFGVDDLSVFVDGTETELFSVVGTFVSGRADDAKISLVTAANGVDVEIYGTRVPRRDDDYLGNNPNLAQRLQEDADRITAVQQEQARDGVGTLKVSAGSPSVAPLTATEGERANAAVAFSEDGKRLVPGPSVSQIGAAQGYAQAASNSANLAQKWANEDEDTVVAGGEFSAKHYAAKAATFDPALYLSKSGNLAGLANVPTARTNLGLGSSATQDSTAFATAAQGTKADNALPASSKADQPTAEAGTNNTDYMTPLRTADSIAANQAVQAWINFSGTTNVIRASHNVTSITDHGTGDYSVNFTTAMPDENYAIAGFCGNNTAGISGIVSQTNAWGGPTASSCRIRTGLSTTAAAFDTTFVMVAFFR